MLIIVNVPLCTAVLFLFNKIIFILSFSHLTKYVREKNVCIQSILCCTKVSSSNAEFKNHTRCHIDSAFAYIFALKCCIISVFTSSNETKNVLSKELFWYEVNDAFLKILYLNHHDWEITYVDLNTK